MAAKAHEDRHTLETTAARAAMARRTASRNAAFFLPYLKPGMSLLDAGCGSGSITLGLAEVVRPGEVQGVDVNADQVKAAAAAAAEEGINNVTFRTGNVYELPYDDASFDAVFSHAVLEHLSDPVRALREFKRVLKPGCVVGIRSFDARGGILLAPPDPDLLEGQEKVRRLVSHNGGNWDIGSDVKRLMREAGLIVEDMGAEYDNYSTPDQMRFWARMAAQMCREGSVASQWLELGWSDHDSLERLAERWLAWAENPDAFMARPFVHTVGRKS